MATENATDNGGWIPIEGVVAQSDRLDLADLDLIAEAAHPIRGTILRRLKEPRTVADLAELLDVPITRLYHHVNRLIDAGLIQAVATRQVAAVTERRYQTVAQRFGAGPELLNSTNPRELSAALGSLFDVAKTNFQRYTENGAFPVRDDEDEHTALILSEVHLTEDRRRDLMGRLRALMEEFRSDTSDDDPEAITISLFLAVNPEPK
jgi:DNA-binding transcriptional ArsR family regulator